MTATVPDPEVTVVEIEADSDDAIHDDDSEVEIEVETVAAKPAKPAKRSRADAATAEAPAADPTPGEATTFAMLGLPKPILKAVQALGYEAATPIQAATIPEMLAGHDVLGQAQTGTGKTAAFALPILSMLNLSQRAPQALVLVPTRELAIQVAEAFQKYAAGQPSFQVLPIYGGQSYTPQIAALARGPQVIVGTPGRIIDHLERGTLSFANIRQVVLDEADEMLAMGFADALEVILSQIPAERQVALFSATMPAPIRRIARQHQRDPREVVIKGQTTTAANIRQRYWMVSGLHKLDALTRVVEAEDFDAMLVFVRTRQAAQDLADRLLARGVAAAALSGDVPQAQRERIIEQLKRGRIDVLVATDVAARGLDVERITHVVNYDVPYDLESYVHRIGRTGRAGRSGEAILFVTPRERRMLKLIEKSTRQPIAPLALPTVEDVNRRRLARFKAKIGEALAATPSEFFRQAIQEVSLETGADLLAVASAAASLIDGPTPLESLPTVPEARDEGGGRATRTPRSPRGARAAAADGGFADDGNQQTWRLAVGQQHGVQPGNIVGALAHEGGLDGSQINGLEIRADHSVVRLPANLPTETIERLAKVRVRGQALALRPERASRARTERSYDRAQPGSDDGTGGERTPVRRAARRTEADGDSIGDRKPGPKPRKSGLKAGAAAPKPKRAAAKPGKGSAKGAAKPRKPARSRG